MSVQEIGETSFLQLALDLAARGFHVFPIIAGGRTPAIPDNLSRATRDPDTIRRWWCEHDPVMHVDRERDYNVGIATERFGESQHLVVVDVDVKKNAGGEATLGNLQIQYGDEWLETYLVRTPSGGRHYYFLADQPVATTVHRIGPGIDTRGAGGYVVAPGSVIGERGYQPLGGVMRAAPDWLVEIIGRPAPRTRQDGNVVAILDLPPTLDRAAQWLRESAPEAVEGSGGDATTYRVACRVKDFGVTELMCLQLMWSNWNERCSPPWGWEELAVKVSNAYSYGSAPVGIANPTADFEPVADDEFPEIETEAAKAPEPLTFTRPAVFAAQRAPAREWLVEGLIPAGKTTILTGDGGVGKSLLGQQLLTSIDTGRPWLGREVMQGPVFGIFSEDDTNEMWRRQQDIGEAVGVELGELQNSYWWTADDVVESGCVLMNFTRENPGGKGTPFFAKVRRAVEQLRPRVVLFDPVANMFGGSELDRVQVTLFVNRVANFLCSQYGTTVVLIAHPSVSGIAEGSGRSGSTGWGNAVRSRLYLTRTEDDPRSDRRVLTTTKANYGKMGAEILLEWRSGAFHLQLDKEGRPMDPDRAAEAAFCDALAALITSGRHVSVKDRATNYAPRVIKQMPEANDVTQKALEGAMRRLLAENVIRVEVVRKDRKDLEVLTFTPEGDRPSAAAAFD